MTNPVYYDPTHIAQLAAMIVGRNAANALDVSDKILDMGVDFAMYLVKRSAQRCAEENPVEEATHLPVYTAAPYAHVADGSRPLQAAIIATTRRISREWYRKLDDAARAILGAGWHPENCRIVHTADGAEMLAVRAANQEDFVTLYRQELKHGHDKDGATTVVINCTWLAEIPKP